MYTLDPGGIYLAGEAGNAQLNSKLIPYGEIQRIHVVSLWHSIFMGWNPFGKSVVERYMGDTGDPMKVLVIETAEGRYFMRGPDVDGFAAEARQRLTDKEFLIKPSSTSTTGKID